MNIAIRGKTEGGGLDLVDGTPYSLVYTYWLATSQLLELYASARTRVTKQGKRRQLRMEMADIKKQLAEALI